jgi:hypothetical protein
MVPGWRLLQPLLHGWLTLQCDLDYWVATLRFMIGGHCNIPGWWPVQRCVADGHCNGFWLMDTSIVFSWRTQEWFLVDGHYYCSLFMDPPKVLVYGSSNGPLFMDPPMVPGLCILQWFLFMNPPMFLVYGHSSSSVFMDPPMVLSIWTLQWFRF